MNRRTFMKTASTIVAGASVSKGSPKATKDPRQKPIPAKWLKIIGQIPGYDPVATCGDAWFEPGAAQRALDFFQHETDGCLRHVEGALAGQLFRLEPWQQAIVANLFGWVRTDDHGRVVRRYREAFIYVPRKNGKTPVAAAICNYVLFCDGEPGAQISSFAADTDQASLLYRHAKGMVEQEPELASRAKIYKGFGHRSIVLSEDEGSVYRVHAADAAGAHGGNPHLVIVDELHAQPNRELIDVLQTSFASVNRAQPLFICITTADFERESICNEKHDYAGKVRDGIIDNPAFLPVIYEAKDEEDWTAPEVWAKANPNLGVSVSLDYLRGECQRAIESSAYRNTFKRLHLNIRTKSDVVWLRLEKWDACGTLPVDPKQLARRPCFGGLDLSTTTDISALELVFPEGEGFLVLSYFWVPRENAALREHRDRVPYTQWIRDGFIKATEGDVVDYDVIRTDINALAKQFNLKKLAIDRWNATQLAVQLGGDGITVELFGQGFASMNAPAKLLENLVTAGRLAHGGNPVLRWMASNVIVETDAAGNIKPSKKKSRERIDGMVALVMGLGAATSTITSESVYRKGRGLVII